MKTAIKTLFATALTAIVLSSTAFSTFAKDGEKTAAELSSASSYNMLQVKGNVRVYLSQGNKENVRVERNSSEDKVAVQKLGNKLLISSEESSPVTVYVTLKDLKRIEAYDQSYVKTEGSFTLPVLQIFLNDQAQADVNVKTAGLYSVTKGHSSLKLSGQADEHILIKEDVSKLKTEGFAALKTESGQRLFTQIDFEAQFTESLKVDHIVAMNRK
ncbi:GIN domain-containing protein [Pedobacter nutrimenti]|jgi:hypothetical protein|uniref:Putative auto-transporter adhesin head GIN domain-containing protein n=1 Tax=Pedobacter nutrimenti TaxID=1241337 RepID=A0A318UCN7_9SPHI|nr:DUF2807 domain-containing protein [Pedobacter nutrimenti]PYF70687.1 hypothetical protein B0O44_108113 [Pedobacter nutrimenti]